MSIILTTQVLSLKNLSQSEKHILTVLCFRANQKNESYSSIDRLSNDCSCSIKTIERGLKGLRDKGLLIYTGNMAPNSRSIPIYCIDLTHGQNGGGSTLTTDNLSLTHPQNGVSRTPKMGIRIDNKNKDNKKDNGASRDFSFNPKTTTQNPTALDHQEFAAGIKGYEWVGEWLSAYTSKYP